MTIRVVTDSASDLDPAIADDLGIVVIPCRVNFGTESFKDGVHLTSDDFYNILPKGTVFPSTSQPPPGDFIEVFDEIGKDADGIVSVHVSSKVSGTYNSAIQGKDQCSTDCPIEVIDSTQASMALGLVVIAAAETAQSGASLSEVKDAANDAASRSQSMFVLDTVEYLQKGGRIGKAQALLGTILKIKPMIIMRDGEVGELGKARTFGKALVKLQETARSFSSVERLSVSYTSTPDLASEIADDLRDMIVGDSEPLIARIGPSIGTHAGPGSIGICLIQSSST